MPNEPCPGVLLHHSLPNGSAHFDLLLSRDPNPQDADARCLVSFRLNEPPEMHAAGAIDCHRMPDHRAHYLTHEGEVGGGRGDVRRVGSYMVRWIEDSADVARFELRTDAGTAQCEASRVDAVGGWKMIVRPGAGAGR